MIDKEKRIEQKKAELMETFEELPEEKLKVARDLIAQAAFLAVSLEDLSSIIGKEGMTEEYRNGKNQSGRKISSNAKMYSSLIGKYNTIVGSLLKIVPPPPKPPESMSEWEIRRIEEEEHRRMFTEAHNYITALEKCSPEAAKEIKEMRETSFGLDYIEAAKTLRERGYTIE